MNKQIITRAMTAVALILAASINIHAQLGGAVNRARSAAQQTVQGATEQAKQSTEDVKQAANQTVNETTQAANQTVNDATEGAAGTPATSKAQPSAAGSIPAVSAGTQTPLNQRTAIDKLKDESKRTAPKVPEIISGASRQGGAMHKFLTDDFYKMSDDEMLAFKAKLEARNAENIEIYSALWEVQGNVAEFVEKHDFGSVSQPSMKPGVSEAMSTTTPANELLAELSNFKLLISEVKSKATEYATIRIEGDYATGSATSYVDRLSVGTHYIVREGNNWMFKTGSPPLVQPAGEDAYKSEHTKYTNIRVLLRIDGSAHQHEAYWKADIARRTIVMAQRYSITNETKAAVPVPQMNDAALTAKMLKLAQETYPTWGIVKLIIAESAWRPETNALGVIIHRQISTKIILPRASGSGFIMRTLSFIEPYAGGSYGEARTYGIGIDEVSVDYK
jgi:hypothetical protein